METEFYYIVVQGTDGSLVTLTELPKEPLTSSRPATTGDIFMSSRQIVDEIKNQDLIGRIAQAVTAQLNPGQPTISDRVKEVLEERGIKPESAPPVA